MTDTISDEARALVAEVLKASLYENVSKGANPALVAQSALTAARLKGREEAAKHIDVAYAQLGNEFAEAIRAMDSERCQCFNCR